MTSQIAISKKTGKRPVSIEKSTYWFTIGFTLFSMIYLISVQTSGAALISFSGADAESSQLTLSLIECFSGLVFIQIPSLITKLFRVKLPDGLCTGFYFFIIGAIPLGEVFSFYYKISIWDSILHYSSGIMLWMLGSLILVSYLRAKKCENLITPAFVGIISVLFAVSLGVLWEFYEFTFDTLLGMNMQKFLLQDGTALVGKAALMDTMKDLIVDFLGAATGAALFAPALKRKKGWLYSFGADAEQRNIQELTRDETVLPEHE